MYPFRIGQPYTRKAIFEIIGVPVDTEGGVWLTGYARQGEDWFIFATVGDTGRTGHNYENWWEERTFHWVGKTGSHIRQPSIRHMISGQGLVYIFTRTDSRDPFTFQGFGTMTRYEDTKPIRIAWAVHDAPVLGSAGERVEGEEHTDASGHQLDDIDSDSSVQASDVTEPPERIPSVVNRIIRDTTRSQRLKRRYEHRCQVCTIRLEIEPGRYYSEAHHIRPLGGTHQGLDREDNMLVLCPNHHALFDLGAVRFVGEHAVEIGGEVLSLRLLHALDQENLRYHNSEIARG